ncbi:CBS domain-containing protein [Alicyclobacillus tolerans]|uniref:CBS domain-containing protein n=1 Tax=Alicyclobacillus tolerans TaxID=90970 RepID=UPI001F436C62|nr:CBS domain-containing protein [Alicyclobacillus tolerans]MCF8568332.1 CBS domain-containing protein [Alicyclobacillus tolerans]
MNIRELMTSDVSCCQASDSIEKAAQIMKSVNCGSIPVCEKNKVIGIITDRDIVLKALAGGKGTTCKVNECMSTQVITCTPDTDVHEAADLMAQHQIRRLPVCDAAGNIVGICSIGDLATVNILIDEAGGALSRKDIPTGSRS